jgi:nondiscriminating aspartyl-tRNA synthetase
LPFEINKKTTDVRLDTLLNHRVLSLRHPQLHATFRIQSALAGAFRDFLYQRDFTQIFTPKIVSSGTEGGSNLFPVDYFGRQAYLAQSPQFYKQMMVGAGYERVFEIAPVYRAEEHNTSRHLNEYVSLDVEMGFIRSDDDLMDLEQELLWYVLEKVAAECEAELALLGVDVRVPSEIPRIPVEEAQHILQRKYGKTSPKGDLDPEGERLICRYAAENGKPAFVFITRYPREVRPMYAMPAPDNEELTSSFDLIFNGLEITTGGQRIHDYEMLLASMLGRGLNPDHFAGYLDVFRYGMPQHGGFAIGLERLTSRLLGLSNVREASAFPRDRTRLAP